MISQEAKYRLLHGESSQKAKKNPYKLLLAVLAALVICASVYGIYKLVDGQTPVKKINFVNTPGVASYTQHVGEAGGVPAENLVKLIKDGFNMLMKPLCSQCAPGIIPAVEYTKIQNWMKTDDPKFTYTEIMQGTGTQAKLWLVISRDTEYVNSFNYVYAICPEKGRYYMNSTNVCE
eukprot:910696_1